MNRKYKFVEYADIWTRAFDREEKIIRDIFGDEVLETHHIGSTSVPGLGGKPTLDVMIVVRDMSKVDSFNNKMKAAGYEPMGAYVTPTTRLFTKTKDGERTRNIHVVGMDDPKLEESLAFRDYLRSHPKEAKVYNDFKQALATEHPDDYFTYRRKKDPFIQDMLERVRKWRKKNPQSS
ncbi:GrpB family protein [Candidatus Uhrbacteria bacterium]|nr:GrpB family protein [Candidatus Uhrbacteria bacterium]